MEANGRRVGTMDGRMMQCKEFVHDSRAGEGRI